MDNAPQDKRCESSDHVSLTVLLALLRQGCVLQNIGLLALLVGLFGIVLANLWVPSLWVSIIFTLSVFFGLGQVYYHVRVQFDCALLQSVVAGDLTWHQLDQGLLYWQLIPHIKDRSAMNRATGMMALFIRQRIWLLLQWVSLSMAVFGWLVF